MCCMMTLNRNAEMLAKDHHHWMGIVLMLVSKKKILKLYSLLTVVLEELDLS